jgi:hypothetical protein
MLKNLKFENLKGGLIQILNYEDFFKSVHMMKIFTRPTSESVFSQFFAISSPHNKKICQVRRAFKLNSFIVTRKCLKFDV